MNDETPEWFRTLEQKLTELAGDKHCFLLVGHGVENPDVNHVALAADSVETIDSLSLLALAAADSAAEDRGHSTESMSTPHSFLRSAARVIHNCDPDAEHAQDSEPLRYLCQEVERLCRAAHDKKPEPSLIPTTQLH